MLMAFLVLFVATACGDAFQSHPYDVDVDGKTNINATNMTLIEQRCAGKDTLRVAVMSDSHQWISDTEDVVADINRHAEVDFVMHLGDLTDTSTGKEFEWSRKALQRLQRPWVALIGNHDFLGTGEHVYRKMYGELNFSFIAGDIKFVCLNTNATEYDYMAAVPDFDYMLSETTADSARFSRTVVAMHARPYSDQFNNNVANAWEYYVHLFPGLICCINGHDHYLQEENLYGDGVMYYGMPSCQKRSYLIFTFTPDDYSYEVVQL